MNLRYRMPIAVAVVLAVTACSGAAGAPPSSTAGASSAASSEGGSPTSSTGASSVAGGSDSAFTPVYKDGILQPLADGFPNKPITMLNEDDAGSDDGIYLRQLQGILKSVSPVPLEVKDKPGPQFGMWTGITELNASEDGKQGYEPAVESFTGASLDLVTSPITRDLGLELKDVNPVIATERVPVVLATRADAPWQTWQEFVDYGKANPGKLRYIANVGSQLDIAVSSILKRAGVTVKKIPGGSTPQVLTAVAAGAGDFGMGLPGNTLPHFQAGKVRILLVFGETAPAPWADVPTTTAIGYPNEPWGTVRGFIVASATPETHRLWLAELFRKATESAEYQQRTTTIPGLKVQVLDKDQVMQVMEQMITLGTPIIRDLNLAWDQQ